MENVNTEIVIRPTSGFSTLHLHELWEYRELIYFLVWRDIKVKYKQTFFGAAWAIFRPLMAMVIFTFVFNKLAGFTSEGVPYVVFTMCGIVAWNFFAEGVGGASQSLLINANLITKVYFPRIIIPFAAILSGVLDFLIALIMLMLMMMWFHCSPSAQILFFPLFFGIGVVTSLGLGLWFSSLSVQYRDVAHALPFFIQLLFWISPVGYSSTRVPEMWQIVYWINPMTCVIEGYRWSLLHTGTLPISLAAVSLVSCIIIFITGVMQFLRTQQKFADVI